MKTFIYWKDFFLFLISPDYNETDLKLKNKLSLTVNMLVLQILLVLPVVAIISHFSTTAPIALLKTEEHTYTVIGLAIFAGVFEEIVFRLLLTKFNILYFSISLSGLTFIGVKKVYFHTMLLGPEGLLYALIIAVICFPLFYFMIKTNKEKLSEFWQEHFAYVFYISAFLFAISHFFNGLYLELSNLKLNIVHLIIALIAGFVRIRAGLIAIIILHIIYDIII
jgi:hypothetical protein